MKGFVAFIATNPSMLWWLLPFPPTAATVPNFIVYER